MIGCCLDCCLRGGLYSHDPHDIETEVRVRSHLTMCVSLQPDGNDHRGSPHLHVSWVHAVDMLPDQSHVRALPVSMSGSLLPLQAVREQYDA